MQVSEKGDFDWALVSCAAAGQKTGSHWTQVTVFLGAVAPIPYAVNSPLLDRDELSSDSIASIGETSRPPRYRRHQVHRLSPECYGVEKAHGAHGDVDAGG
jgi:CO/xanthine dehydrogenase FAD-binding subunit